MFKKYIFFLLSACVLSPVYNIHASYFANITKEQCAHHLASPKVKFPIVLSGLALAAVGLTKLQSLHHIESNSQLGLHFLKTTIQVGLSLTALNTAIEIPLCDQQNITERLLNIKHTGGTLLGHMLLGCIVAIASIRK